MSAPANYKSTAGRDAVMTHYDRALARWPVPFEPLQVPTRHGDTFVIASGDPAAPPLILLHGSCSNAVSWVGDVATYATQRRVYAVDSPGEPGRSTPNRPSWRGPAFADWLTDVLAGLDLDRAALLGISQGGWTALRFATRHPERVERLILLAPGGVVAPRAAFIVRAMALSLLGRRGAAAINRYVLGDFALAPEALAFLDAIMTHFRPRMDAQPIFGDDELRRLTMPSLAVMGQRDVIFASQRAMARLQRCVPDLEAVLRPDDGHALVNLGAEVLPFLTARAPRYADTDSLATPRC